MMTDFNPFDMDLDGDIDGTDFLGGQLPDATCATEGGFRLVSDRVRQGRALYYPFAVAAQYSPQMQGAKSVW